MEQIFVESSQSYNHGFILNVQDVEYLVELMDKQFRKISNNDVVHEFRIRYRNGVVARTFDLESVLEQENKGTVEIVSLRITSKLRKPEFDPFKNDEDESVIELEFNNPKALRHTVEAPIHYSIHGQSRDWAFVASAALDDKITLLKRKQIVPTSMSSLKTYEIIYFILFCAFIAVLLVALPDSSQDLYSSKIKAITEIENGWKNKTITDPVQVAIMLEKVANDNHSASDDLLSLGKRLLSKPRLLVLIAAALFSAILYNFINYYPLYNFCWSGYMQVFEKQERTRKAFLIGTVVAGLLLAAGLYLF